MLLVTASLVAGLLPAQVAVAQEASVPEPEAPAVSPQSGEERVLETDGGYELEPDMLPLPPTDDLQAGDEPAAEDEKSPKDGKDGKKDAANAERGALDGAGVEEGGATASLLSVPALMDHRVEDTDSVTPAVVGEGDSSTSRIEFNVRVVSSSTWNLAAAVQVPVDGNYTAAWRVDDGDLRIAQGFDWQVRACGGGGCSAWSTVTRSYVNPAVGAGHRRNDTVIDLPVGDDFLSVGVNVGTGGLSMESTAMTLPGVTEDLVIGSAYGLKQLGGGATYNSQSSHGRGWTTLIGRDVRLFEQDNGNVTYMARGLFATCGGDDVADDSLSPESRIARAHCRASPPLDFPPRNEDAVTNTGTRGEYECPQCTCSVRLLCCRRRFFTARRCYIGYRRRIRSLLFGSGGRRSPASQHTIARHR